MVILSVWFLVGRCACKGLRFLNNFSHASLMWDFSLSFSILNCLLWLFYLHTLDAFAVLNGAVIVIECVRRQRVPSEDIRKGIWWLQFLTVDWPSGYLFWFLCAAWDSFNVYICFVVGFERVLWQWTSHFCPLATFRQWMLSKLVLLVRYPWTVWRGLSHPTLTSFHRSLLGWRNLYFCLVNIHRITYSITKPCSEYFTNANSWFILAIILMPVVISSGSYCINGPRFHCC